MPAPSLALESTIATNWILNPAEYFLDLMTISYHDSQFKLKDKVTVGIDGTAKFAAKLLLDSLKLAVKS